MASKRNEFILKTLDNLLGAGVFVLASAPWSFSVVIASKKSGNLSLCVDCRSPSRVLKTDGWRLLRIAEAFDDPRGSRLFTALDLFGYWQIKKGRVMQGNEYLQQLLWNLSV